MFEFEGKEYTLKFNMKRIELIEERTEMPTIANIRRTGGCLGLADLKTYFAMGLKEPGADSFVMPRPAYEIAEKMIEEQGYAKVLEIVTEALERDCPFFFPKD